jgi:hypothetical protein
MDTELESIFQERLQHRSTLGHVDVSIRDGAPRGHIEAFAIKPSWTADDFVYDRLWIAAVRQCNKLARRCIDRLEGVRTKPCVSWGN